LRQTRYDGPLAISGRAETGVGVGVGADDKNGIASRADAVGVVVKLRVLQGQMMMAGVDDDVGDVDVDGVDVGTAEEFVRAASVGPGVASAAAAAADAGGHGRLATNIGVEARADAVVGDAVAAAIAVAAAATGVAEVRGAHERPEAAAGASRAWTGKLVSRLALVVVGDGAVVERKGAGAGAGGIEAAARALGAVAGPAVVGTRQLHFQGIPNLPTA
jgi:hypothetical protein